MVCIRRLFLLLGMIATPAIASPTISVLTDSLEHPWGLAFLPEGDVLVTERPGRLQRIELATGRQTIIPGTPTVSASGQGGLLDIALHPNFADNRWVYLTWAGHCETGTATHLGRGRLVGNALEDFETLFVATPCVDSGRHFGSRIVFDTNGYLFMTTGDRGERDRAQDLTDHNGAVLRLNDNGSIPSDNPFVDDPRGADAIYSYGHRNPQGVAIYPDTGALWIHEHGPRGGDEINLPVPGGNFGWPKVTYGREYWGPQIGEESIPGMVDPIYQWTPSIAPSGMAFYRGDLFVGALVQTHLAHLELNGETVTQETQLLSELNRRIRAIAQGPDNLLYLLTDQRNGELLRLSP
ncbi:PQQ-dependent sugar dehydrogenase [Spiribacter salilacus]|nr:PQQ-dependent sugar dehydrogenase [Spiribacter salilacus]